jgi:hypothetical protein
MSKERRKVFRISKSHAMTLPPEWVSRLSKPEVVVIYDKILLAIPAEDARTLEEALERATEQVITQTVLQQARARAE